MEKPSTGSSRQGARSGCEACKKNYARRAIGPAPLLRCPCSPCSMYCAEAMSLGITASHARIRAPRRAALLVLRASHGLLFRPAALAHPRHGEDDSSQQAGHTDAARSRGELIGVYWQVVQLIPSSCFWHAGGATAAPPEFDACSSRGRSD